jgi:FKBP-type peptidyl-prolyl cis-trans isomerase
VLFLGVFACDGIVSRKMSIVTMNRSCLFPAGLLCLGLFVSGCPGKNPKEQKASGAPAPATTVPATVPAAAPGSSDDQIIESLGWSIGKRLSLPELEFSKEQVDLLVKGLLEAAAGKEAPSDPQTIGRRIDAFMRQKQSAYRIKVRNENLAAGKAYFEKLKENESVVDLPSGLRYEILQPGTGASPTATDTIKVHYTGKLLNGTVFDSSVQHGKPMETQLNRVIPGWTEGLQKINQGGKIRLYVPPQLAYGDSGRPGIPPGATLVFDVELIAVKSARPAPVAPKN